MTFSPLADMSRRLPDGGRSTARNAPISGVGYHHNAGVNAFGEATNPNRVVSAQYWITNEGVIIPHIDEGRRAFTSGHALYPAGAQADHRNITMEISNSPEGVRTGSWAISDAAMDAVVRLTADIYRRHKLGRVKRGASMGLGVHRDWVPTECPGGYIMDNLDAIIDRANAINYPPKEKPVALTPNEKKQLNDIHAQTADIHAFRRPVTRDGKKVAMRQDLADTGTIVRRILTAVTRPVNRWIGGERVEVSQIQELADTNSLAREALVQQEIGNTMLRELCRKQGLNINDLRDEGFAAGMERLKGLLGARAGNTPNDPRVETD